jgi:hypothetical protein
MSTLGTALADEALSAIDFHPIASAPAIQTPTLPSKTRNAYCLGTHQTHSNALPHLADAEEFTIIEDNATSADYGLPLMKRTPACKFALMNSTPDIPAPSTTSIQNIDADMAPVAAAVAEENVHAMNQPLPPSPSSPSFIAALSSWFRETESEGETSEDDQKRLEENNAELKVRKRVPAVPGAFVPVLQSFVICWIGFVVWTLVKVPGLRISFYLVFGVAWMILVKHWFFD